MRRLADAREHLDGPLDRRVLAGNLRDLTRVNALLGGNVLSWRAIEPYLERPRAGTLSLMDVGTGAADVPRELIRRARAHGGALEALATDIRPEIVDFARRAGPPLDGLEIRLTMPGPLVAATDEFDIVHASLVLHHLEPTDARALLAEMARVARTAVVVNDLDRARVWLLGARLLTRLATRNPYTRHDAPLSVRRAYTIPEVATLASQAGLRLVARHRSMPPYRYALVFQHRENVRAGND